MKHALALRDTTRSGAGKVPLFDLSFRLSASVRSSINASLRCSSMAGSFSARRWRSWRLHLRRYTGARHVVGVSSGRDALIISLMALGVGAGDAVFVPAFTFSATAGAVVAAGAVPVFTDVDPVTLTMDAEQLERAIKRTLRKRRCDQGHYPGRSLRSSG